MSPVPKQNLGSLVIGLLVALTGGLALGGWLFDFSLLVRMLPGIEKMAPNTALAFVLAGAWVVLAATGPRRPVLMALGAAVSALAAMVLVQYLTGVLAPGGGLQILLNTRADRVAAGAFGGRMVLGTALALLLSGAAMLALGAVRSKGGMAAAMSCIFCAGIIGMLGVSSNIAGFEILVLKSGYAQMSLYTALCLVALSVALWGLNYRKAYTHLVPANEAARTVLAASSILLFTTLFASLLVFSITEKHAAEELQRGLARTLNDRSDMLQRDVANALREAEAVTGRRPLFRERLLALAEGRASKKVQSEIGEVLDHVMPGSTISAFRLFGADGALIGARGTMVERPTLSVPLKEVGQAVLLWDKRYVLRIRLSIIEQGRKLGSLIAEIPLLAATAMLADFSGLGESGEALVCAPHKAGGMQCFPSRHTAQVVLRQRAPDAVPLPMDFALAGQKGVVATLDYRKQRVIAAYSPVGELGLGQVLKMDEAEFYQSLRERIGYVLPVLGAMLVLGILLIRWQVAPLVRETVNARNRVKATLDNVAEGIITFDEKNLINSFNPAAGRIFGYPPEEALGINIRTLLPGLDATHPQPCESTGRRKDGSEFFMEATVSEVVLDGGRSHIAVVRDVTQHRLAQDLLWRQAQIIEQGHDAIFSLDTSGRIISWNHGAERLFGFAKERIFGQPLDWICPSRDCKLCQGGKLLDDMASDGSGAHEMVLHHASGEAFHAHLSMSVLKNDAEQEIGLICYAIDISARKLAEQALSESEKKFRSLVETTVDWFWEMDENGIYTYVSPRVMQLLGYAPEEVIGKTPFQFMPPEEAKRIGSVFAGIAAEKSAFHLLENINLHKDGRLVTLETSGVPFYDDAGVFCGYRGIDRDITGRKLVETSLRESEDRFRGTFEQAAVGMAHVAPDGHFLRVNDKLCEIVGYSGEELMALTFQEITYAQDLQADLDKASCVLAGEIPFYDMEKRYIRKNGALVWINLTVSLVREPSGAPEYFIAVIEDISRRKLAEGILSQQAQIINQTHDAVFSADTKGTLVSWNRGAELLFGHGSDAAIGQPVEFIALPGEQKLFYHHVLLGLIRSGGGVLETRLARKSGAPFDAWFSLSLLKDNEGMEIGVACYVTDISARKRMEQELRESETRLAKAQKMARLGSWDWEIATGEILWSDEVYHIFGLDLDTPVTFDLFLGSVHPEDRELVEKSLTAVLVREVNFNVDVRIFPAGGEVRFIHAEGEVEFDGGGKALRMFGTVQDITERKEIEQEIRASREQLRELSSHLQAAREEEKATIAREIHDELGGNLTALKMDISWLARKLPPEMEAALEKTGAMADLVDTSVHAMRRIVTELRPTVLDDLGLLAAMSWQASEFTKRYGIQCTVVMHGEEILVGDACRIALFRIFQESLTNAARYSKADRVQVDVWREHDKIALDIVDNGIGLPEDKAMDPTSHGLRGMMERARTLGGSVEIGSAPGEGVAISVRIPLPAEEETPT